MLILTLYQVKSQVNGVPSVVCNVLYVISRVLWKSLMLRQLKIKKNGKSEVSGDVVSNAKIDQKVIKLERFHHQ